MLIWLPVKQPDGLGLLIQPAASGSAYVPMGTPLSVVNRLALTSTLVHSFASPKYALNIPAGPLIHNSRPHQSETICLQSASFE